MPIKVMDQDDDVTEVNAAQGIEFALENGARILNYSFGGHEPQLLDSVVAADAAGAIQIASAGNGIFSTVIEYPAVWPQTIAVGATDCNDVRGLGQTQDCEDHAFKCPDDFKSAFGPALDVVAPGTQNFGAIWHTGTDVDRRCGTSYAAPIVTGLVGLMHSVNPSLGKEEARHLIRAGAEDGVGPSSPAEVEDALGFDNNYGWGRVNMHRTLQATEASITLRADKTAPGTLLEFVTPNMLATTYDFIRGDLSVLGFSTAVPEVVLGTVECIEDDSSVPSTVDVDPDPAPGQSYFYLSRFTVIGPEIPPLVPLGPGSYGGSLHYGDYRGFRDRVANPNLCD